MRKITRKTELDKLLVLKDKNKFAENSKKNCNFANYKFIMKLWQD